MATKLHIMSELAVQTTQQLAQSVDNWKSFLNSAAWLYKYPFHEQVLIHAQRPDATACAPMQLWNSRFGRWVNKDAKGIAVIDDSGDKPRLKYLFDVSDTNARHNAPFRLWHIKPEYEVQVIKELQNAFGETGSESESLSDTILGTVINAVSDNYTDYCNDFLEAATDGAFADMDSEERTAAFILQLVTGVSHIALVRLGIEPSSVLSEDDYAGILQFNSTGAINQLGAAVSDISELVLRQIERSVRSISRQQRGTLAKPSNTLQNEADEAERSDDDGNVRAGNVRILLGSTAKMGAGTNVQKRLIAEHHLDIPWRPSDIEQREGRILRQGNENKRVDIFRYVTENTFDSYMWQTIENKQKFISQIMTSKSPVRSCEDVDETALSYAEIKALATGNPHIKEKMDLEIEVSRLKLVKANYLSQKYTLEDSLLKHYPKEIRLTQERINGYEADIALYGRHKSEDFPGMLLYGTHYEEKKEAGTAILEACKAMTSPEPKEVGSYRGFTLLLSYDIVAKVFRMTLRGELSHTVELGSDIHGNIQRMENMLESLPSRLSACEKALATLKEQMENAKAEVEKPFEQEQELSEKAARLAELNALLNMDKRENAALDAEPEHTEIETVKAFCKER